MPPGPLSQLCVSPAHGCGVGDRVGKVGAGVGIYTPSDLSILFHTFSLHNAFLAFVRCPCSCQIGCERRGTGARRVHASRHAGGRFLPQRLFGRAAPGMRIPSGKLTKVMRENERKTSPRRKFKQGHGLAAPKPTAREIGVGNGGSGHAEGHVAGGGGGGRGAGRRGRGAGRGWVGGGLTCVFVSAPPRRASAPLRRAGAGS
jgi:hypothetical protein